MLWGDYRERELRENIIMFMSQDDCSMFKGCRWVMNTGPPQFKTPPLL